MQRPDENTVANRIAFVAGQVGMSVSDPITADMFNEAATLVCQSNDHSPQAIYGIVGGLFSLYQLSLYDEPIKRLVSDISQDLSALFRPPIGFAVPVAPPAKTSRGGNFHSVMTRIVCQAIGSGPNKEESRKTIVNVGSERLHKPGGPSAKMYEDNKEKLDPIEGDVSVGEILDNMNLGDVIHAKGGGLTLSGVVSGMLSEKGREALAPPKQQQLPKQGRKGGKASKGSNAYSRFIRTVSLAKKDSINVGVKLRSKPNYGDGAKGKIYYDSIKHKLESFLGDTIELGELLTHVKHDVDKWNIMTEASVVWGLIDDETKNKLREMTETV